MRMLNLWKPAPSTYALCRAFDSPEISTRDMLSRLNLVYQRIVPLNPDLQRINDLYEGMHHRLKKNLVYALHNCSRRSIFIK